MMETVKSKTSRTTYLALMLRLGLGTIFFVAGAQKIGEPAAFARSIANYQLVSSDIATWSAVLVPWLEILVGGFLILGWLTRVSALAATGLSVGFAIFTGSALARGLNVDCGCFTGASGVSGVHFLANLFMIGIGFFLGLKGAPRLSLDSYLNELDRRSLKSPLITLTVILLTIGGGLVLNKHLNQPHGTARIVFEQELLELGLVPQEKETRITVPFRNLGSETANISKVESTCACTKAELSKKNVLPGESGEITVVYKPGENTGQFEQKVRLIVEGQSDLPMLSLRGEIDPMTRALPGVFKVAPGDSVVAKIESRREGFIPTVKGFSSSLNGLDMEQIGPASDGSPQIRLTLRIPLPQPKGQANAWPVRVELEGVPSCLVYLQAK